MGDNIEYHCVSDPRWDRSMVLETKGKMCWGLKFSANPTRTTDDPISIIMGGRSMLKDRDAERDEAYLAVRAAVTLGLDLLVLLSIVSFGIPVMK